MTDKSAENSVSSSAPGKMTTGPDAATGGALSDGAWFMLYAFIAIFIVSALVTLIRSRKGPKQ